ncbi:MAG: hypothetical protein ACFB0C_19605 [Leptolyngbyaceae cyanobacterium]
MKLELRKAEVTYYCDWTDEEGDVCQVRRNGEGDWDQKVIGIGVSWEKIPSPEADQLEEAFRRHQLMTPQQ